jgi:hypothetical protein
VDNPYQAPVVAFDEPAARGEGDGAYEFSDSESAIVAKAGRRARIWGIFSLVLGALFLIGGLVALAGSGIIAADGRGGDRFGLLLAGVLGGAGVIVLINGVAQCATGVAYIDAGNALLTAVHTGGSDVGHLMRAVKKLGTGFLLETVATMVVVVATLAGRVIGGMP